MSVLDAIDEAVNVPVENDGGRQGVAFTEFDLFWQRHPKEARDVLYMIDVYERCDRIRHTGKRPTFEEAFAHVFGSAGVPACSRCQPAFRREKRILETPSPL